MPAYLQTRKHQAETALVDSRFDFIAKYHAVGDLRRLASSDPELLDGATIAALETLLQTRAFRRMRQSYILFREAASVLTDMATGPGANGWNGVALTSLEGLLIKTTGHAHRGIAEALGSLPTDIPRPRECRHGSHPPPTVSWPQLLAANRLTPTGSPRYVGRSLVTPVTPDGHLIVVKLARHEDAIRGLQTEIHWMETLQRAQWIPACRFDVPRALYVNRQAVFRLRQLPSPPPVGVSRQASGLAIAYLAHRDYFVYPNQRRIDTPAAREILGRNAYLLGWLTARGVIHDAPIPLFHNRTQRLRRDDQGRYQWFRSGRLDRWLASCRYPNFGLSGLRDFEHLVPFEGSPRSLYRHIGSHLLSLLLVAGSHFRCRETARIGLDEKGIPVDARDLFDRSSLTAMVRDIFDGYRSGFAGGGSTAPPPVDLDRLTRRMIEEMGVDRHMTELLRRVDQQCMTDTAFEEFLSQRGVDEEKRGRMVRGEKDILIASGPHLGDFNRQISLPELIECVAAMSATCIAERFMALRKIRTARDR